MDGIIQVKVKGSYLSKDSDRGGVRGEANVTLMRIEFSEDWVEFEDKRITFLNALGRNPTEIKLTDELLEEGTDKAYLCFIPGEAYTHDGWFSFVIDGYAEGVRKRSVEGKLECVYAPSVDGEHLPADYELAEIKVMSGTRDVVHLPKKGVYFDKVIALGDEDLIPENIKAGVVILGVEGSFEGEKGLLSEIIVRSGPADFIEIPATGFYGIGKVTVEGDPDLVPQNIKAGVTILDVEGTYVPEELKLVAKSLTITQNGKYTVTPGNGYAGMSRVTVTADVPQTVEKIDAELQSKSIMPGTRDINVKPDEGYDALSQVTVYGDGDLVPENIKSGVTIFNVLGTYEKRELQSKSVMPGKTDKTVKADSDYDGLSSVKVYGDSDLIPQNIRKGATIFNVEGTYDTGQNFQSKDVTPGRSSIIVQPDEDYDALSDVFVHGDSNLVPGNIADGVSIFNVKGNYVSPMKEITVVPSHDEQVILPASGYYGFSKITVLSSDATGDYNEGYRDAQEDAAEQIAGLEEQIGQLTQDKNAAYGEGYEEGYDDGYADGAASGGGGYADVRPNLAPLSKLTGSVSEGTSDFTQDGFRWHFIKGDATAGLCFDTSDLVVGELYTFAYKFKKTDGTLKSIGGHDLGFDECAWSLDGVTQEDGYVFPAPVANDEEEHQVVYTGFYRADAWNGDNNFYCQPNRNDATFVAFDVWNVKVERVNAPPAWIPAAEDEN